MSSKSRYTPPRTPTQTITQATLNGLANLIKLLPTGTVFLYQFLNPVLTNNGHCDVANKYLSSILTVVCAFSCCFASFTDSYTDSQGNTHYGIVTNKGLWPSSPTQDLSSYKLRLGDFVHAFFALIVFAVVALLDPNTVACFYPSFQSTQQALLMALPPAIGAASSVIFVTFPNDRHGIGYPSSQGSRTPSSDSD
ncbi:protein DMP2 [Sesamum angolense]|uniref:Protein DMP2 n=1 Tax=Sesamum angolense TaxID=2727404 RepID=A0AAE1X5P6_9LAMI|nr:protein DMP2 [Sesamum angolense]